METLQTTTLLFFELTQKGVNEKIAQLVSAILSKNKTCIRECLNNFTNNQQKLYAKSFVKYLKMPYVKHIFVSQNYAFVQIYHKTTYYVKKWGFLRERERTIHFSLLFGINDDGKLFVNMVNDNLPNFSSTETIATYCYESCSNCAYITVIHDKHVYPSLGYWVDVSNDGIAEIKDATRYRIQGDICLDVRDVDSYYDILENDLKMRMVELAERYVIENIAEFLRQRRIRFRQRERSITFRGMPRWLREKEQKKLLLNLAKEVTEHLVQRLQKFANISYEVVERYWFKIYTNIYFDSSKDGIGLTFYSPTRIPFGVDYKEIEISVDVVSSKIIQPYYEKALNDIKAQLKFRPVELIIDNHKVHLTEALDSVIEFETQIFDKNYFVQIDLQRVLVKKDSKIYLVHDEHKAVVLKFSNDFAINFHTLEVFDNVDKLNYLALKLL